MSGDFITSSLKVGAFRIWNASQKSSKSIIKVGGYGIRQFEAFKENGNLFVVIYKDGSLGVCDIVKKKTIWKIETGHSETIFGLQFKPNDPSIMATGSYDGFIKIWDMNSMKQISTLSQIIPKKGEIQETNARVIYSISWAPGEDTRIATSHASGEITIWDYQKNKVLSKITPGGSAPIFRLEWSQLSPEYVACGSSDNFG